MTLKPISFEKKFPDTPVLVEREYPEPAISLRKLDSTIKRQVGNLTVEVQADPLTLTVTNRDGEVVQKLVFQNNGTLAFNIGDNPILGMGEGGPAATR